MRILTIISPHLGPIVLIMFFRKRGETTLEPPDALRASQELVAARSVKHVLEIYRSEIDRVMGLLGASSLDALRRLDLLVPHAAQTVPEG